MVLKKDAVLAVLKATEGTMNAAGFKLSSPKDPGESDEDIIFTGAFGETTLKLNDNVLSVLCKKNDGDAKEVSQVLFDYSAEDWAIKDCKSVANEVSESVANFYKTQVVYESLDSKKTEKAKATSKKADVPEAPVKKKNKKDSVVTYEAINLANRMENIFPELKGNIEVNTEKYEMFLPEEYFEALATPLIISSIRNEDRQVLKKVFNAFNIFYEEGDNDVQSLIAVSILGVNFAGEPELFEKSEGFMDDDLRDAVKPIMDYLKTISGKNKLKNFHNPEPFKSKRLKKS